MPIMGKGDLTKGETFEIASTMHAVVLEELFRETDWAAPQAVFHGGTALALVRNSTRFSEDLDFMVSAEAAPAIGPALERVRGRVAVQMEILYPGCRIALKGPKGREVEAWQLVWTHDARRGKVMVKAEFLVTSAQLLSAYRATHLVPASRGAIGVHTPIPVPDLVSAWADKVKAIATRPEFKWRDAYDIAWIADCLRKGDGVSDEDRLAALEATAAIYDKTVEDVADGLETVLAAGRFDDVPAFEGDMERWFPDDGFERARRVGLFARQLASAKAEVTAAHELVRDRGPACRP